MPHNQELFYLIYKKQIRVSLFFSIVDDKINF